MKKQNIIYVLFLFALFSIQNTLFSQDNETVFIKGFNIKTIKDSKDSSYKILMNYNNQNDTLLIADDIIFIENRNDYNRQVFFVYKTDGLFGVFNKNIQIPPIYDKIEIAQVESDFLILKIGDKMNLLDMIEGILSKATFNYDKDFKIYKDNYFPSYYLNKNEKYIGFDGRIYSGINQYFIVEGEKKNFYLVNEYADIEEKDRKSSQTFSEIYETEFANVFITKGDDKKFGIINHQLDTLVPFVYTEIEEYFPDYNMFPFDYLFKVYDGKKVGMYSLHRGVLIEPVYNDIDQYYEDEFLMEYFKISNKKNVGIADANGKVILPAEYKHIRTLNNDYGIFDYLIEVKDKKNKLGVYTLKGKEILPPIYDAFDEFIEMYFLESTEFLYKLYQNKKEGVFSTKKGLLIPSKYDYITDFYETDYNTYNVFITQIDKNLFGLYDYHGNELFPCEFDSFQFYPEYALEKDTLIIYTQKEGKYYVNVNYILESTLAQTFSYDNYYNYINGYNGIKIKGDKYEKYNLKTSQLIGTYQKTDTITFEGHSFDMVLLDGKFGAMSKEGVITVPPTYDEGFFMEERSDMFIGYENGIKYYVYCETNERYTEDEW